MPGAVQVGLRGAAGPDPGVCAGEHVKRAGCQRGPRRGIEVRELAQHGSTSACKRSRKSRKPRDTPHTWLRRLTCPFDFGLKVTTIDPETTKMSPTPSTATGTGTSWPPSGTSAAGGTSID